MSKRRKYPVQEKSSMKELFNTFVKTIPALLMPVILLGGILFGFMTPTESACMAVLYAILLGTVGYRNLNIKKLFAILERCSSLCATTMFIIACASIFGLVLTQQQIPQKLTSFFINLSENPVIILLAINILLLVLGCLMETTSIFIILTPILSGLAVALGVDPVHFGVMVVFNVTVALITPPVGMVMFLTCKVANISTKMFIRNMAPFLLVLFAALIIVTYVPAVSTWLPNLIMGK